MLLPRKINIPAAFDRIEHTLLRAQTTPADIAELAFLVQRPKTERPERQDPEESRFDEEG